MIAQPAESSAQVRRLADGIRVLQHAAEDDCSGCELCDADTTAFRLAIRAEARAVLASPEAPARAWVEVQFSPDFGFYVALVPLVPLGCVGFQVDGFTESEDEALVTAAALATALGLKVRR